MSRANAGVSERSEFPDLQRILDFLSLRNLFSNELFFTFYEFATALLLYHLHFYALSLSSSIRLVESNIFTFQFAI